MKTILENDMWTLFHSRAIPGLGCGYWNRTHERFSRATSRLLMAISGNY